MDREELIKHYKQRLQSYKNLDSLRMHILADGVLVELLSALGFGEVTEEYDKLCDDCPVNWYN